MSQHRYPWRRMERDRIQATKETPAKRYCTRHRELSKKERAVLMRCRDKRGQRGQIYLKVSLVKAAQQCHVQLQSHSAN